jgi:glycerophosphoryl diester phosphodiesterase
MKIIGHRGAAGIELENTRASLLAAIKHGADMVELDVHLTADDKLVVIHDPKTGRVAAENVTVRDKTLAELRAIKLDNGEAFQTLDEALEVIGSTPVIIELKDENSVHELLLTLERHPKSQASVASFHPEELRLVRRVLPDVPIFALEYLAPIDIVQTAHKLGAAGIGLNFWLMNPLTYYLAKHYHLEMYVYVSSGKLSEKTMNFTAPFMHLLYPDLHFCTRHPEHFTKAAWRNRANQTTTRRP